MYKNTDNGVNIIINNMFILNPLWKKIKPVFLYDKESLTKYKIPPNNMLNKYRYNKLLKVYLIFLKLNAKITIIIDIIIFIKNKEKEFKLINNNKILKLPIKAANIILCILKLRLRDKLTPISKTKSKKKFNSKIKSTYIFI